MESGRPVNLSLIAFKWPIAALASITHRITGVVLFVGIGFGLYALQLALSSPQGFAEAGAQIATPFGRVVMIGLLLAVVYHLLAGVKHLMLDFHIGDTPSAANAGAVVVIIGTLLVTAALGVLLW